MATKNLMDEADETLGGLIRWKRQRLGMRVVDLAEETGLSPGYISKLELNNASNPSDTIIYRLATALKIDPIELKSRTKSKPIEKGEENQTTSNLGKEGHYSVSVDALQPLRHDATSAQLRLKPAEKFAAAYERLGVAYTELGLLYSTTTQEDGTLDYRSALAAYDASSSIYERSGLTAQLLSTRYRIARTYQNLIVTDRVKPDERLIFLQRAQEILNQIFSADMPAEPNGRQTFLKPASLAVGAGISKLIAREIGDEIDDEGVSQERKQALKTEVDAYVRAGRLRRLQADRLYAEIVRNLDTRLEQQISHEGRLQVQEEKAYSLFLVAVNKRALETEREDKSGRDLAPSIDLFLKAIRLQRDRSRQAQQAEGAKSLKVQAAHRLQLIRFHQELGLAYSYSNIKNRYAELLWQYRISAEVLSPKWAEHTGQRDRYIAGDQYVSDLINSTQSGNDDPRNITTEHHNIGTVNEIKHMVTEYKSLGAFDTLDYPLTYHEARQRMTKTDDI